MGVSFNNVTIGVSIDPLATSGPAFYANAQPSKVQSSQPAQNVPANDAVPLTSAQKTQLMEAANKSVVMLTIQVDKQTGVGSGVIVGEKDGYWIIATVRHNTLQPDPASKDHYVSLQYEPGRSLITQAYPVPMPGGQGFSDLAFVAIRKDFLPGKAAVPLAAELPASGMPHGIVGKELLQAGYPKEQEGFSIGDSEPLRNYRLNGKWVRMTEVRPMHVDPEKIPAGPLLPFDDGRWTRGGNLARPRSGYQWRTATGFAEWTGRGLWLGFQQLPVQVRSAWGPCKRRTRRRKNAWAHPS
jgi:hypothetical protein